MFNRLRTREFRVRIRWCMRETVRGRRWCEVPRSSPIPRRDGQRRRGRQSQRRSPLRTLSRRQTERERRAAFAAAPFAPSLPFLLPCLIARSFLLLLSWQSFRSEQTRFPFEERALTNVQPAFSTKQKKTSPNIATKNVQIKKNMCGKGCN